MKDQKFNNKSAEELLLSNKSLDDLIRIKIQQEIDSIEKNQKNTQEKTIIRNIANVPQNLIFSKKSYFKVFNKANKTESYINGIQADGLLGLQNLVREKFLQGKCDVFSCENGFVKFDRTELD
ncbi:hypothetical protein J6E39_01645 [bacterium]|nr:hypothetical protein [bacterium]